MKKQEHQISNQDVVAYLKENRDFFLHNQEVLLSLNVNSCIEGASLLSAKQVQLLRRQLDDSERKFLDLVSTIRSNEKLSILLHKMSLGVLASLAMTAALDLPERMYLIETVCATALKRQMHDVVLSLQWFAAFAGPQVFAHSSVIDEQDQRVMGLINNVFADDKACYGPFSSAQRTVLLDRFQRNAQSVLVAPLLVPASGQRMGLLTLSSNRPHRFVAGMGTMFLTQLTELIESVFTATAVEQQQDHA